jgi:hypothetical protein
MKRMEEMTLADPELHKLAIANEHAQEIALINVCYKHSQECACMREEFGDEDFYDEGNDRVYRPGWNSEDAWLYFQYCPLIPRELKERQIQHECWEQYCEMKKQEQNQFPTYPDSDALIPSREYSDIEREEREKNWRGSSELYHRLGEAGHYRLD